MMWLLACVESVDLPEESAVVEIELVEGIQAPTLTLSHVRGVYDEAFELSLDADGAEIYVSFDGSEPSERLDGPTVDIDPALGLGEQTAPSVILRAVAVSDNGARSSIQTHTYWFPGRAVELSPDGVAPGPAWPEPYPTNNNGDTRQAMDYGLDPDVTGDPRYVDAIEDSLRSLPTLSIVTELEYLFDDATGIYENAMEDGRDWERPTSLELLDPDDPDRQFQVDAGLRIRGGWSRHPSAPKHSFRFHFRSEYGPGWLEYPLFDVEGADRFDTFDLRTAQNYSWSFKDGSGRENTFIRDVFSRDTQRDMGQPYTRSRYVHLLINGVYWGLYQTQERPEAAWATTYLGGEKDDWDIVKVNGEPGNRVVEATDGDLALWEQIWDLCVDGLTVDEGDEVAGLVDLDNLVDYMLVIFWTGNFDAPTGAFTRNKEANNFFAAGNRRSPAFVFLAHDSEHSMLSTAFPPGVGLTEDRVNLGTRTDEYRMEVSDFQYFHPQWLHHHLVGLDDYRTRFDARVGMHLFDGGALTREANDVRLAQRRAEMESAIVAESARWGDAKRHPARTYDDDWVPAMQRLEEEWLPSRNAILLEQLESAGLYVR